MISCLILLGSPDVPSTHAWMAVVSPLQCRFVDQRAAMGFSPLHMAASHGNLAAVVALIASGASITARCAGYIPAAQQVIACLRHMWGLHVTSF